MKRAMLVLFLAATVFADEPRGELVESMPPATQILASARAQLPPYPVEMTGTLKEKAPNGYVKKVLGVKMTLDWGAAPSQAAYQINDEKSGETKTLDIRWVPAGPEYLYSENGARIDGFDPNSEIEGLGVTWADLSFSFLWSQEAQTLRMGKKLGRECFVISVPRPDSHSLLLWIEKETGRMLGAEEHDETGKRQKIIKVVSVKEFDDLWMVKDLDIIHPARGGKTSLRIDSVEAGN